MLVGCSTAVCWLVRQASTYGQPCRAVSSPDPAKKKIGRKTAQAGPESSVAVHGHGCGGDDDEPGIRRERKIELRRFLGFIWIYLDASPIPRTIQGNPARRHTTGQGSGLGKNAKKFRMWATEAREGRQGCLNSVECESRRDGDGQPRQQTPWLPTRVAGSGQRAVGSGRSW